MANYNVVMGLRGDNLDEMLEKVTMKLGRIRDKSCAEIQLDVMQNTKGLTMKEQKNKTSEQQLALPTDRLALYELVWAKSAESITQNYNISTEQLAKICRSLSVPRPMAGYWKALEKGAAPEKPALNPQSNPPVSVKEHMVGALPHKPNNVGSNIATSKQRKKRQPSTSATEQQNRLIKEARIYFPLGRISDTGYLKPNKKKLLDLVASDNGLEKVLSFADTFFTELLKHGYSVDFDTSKQFSGRPEIDEREVENKSGYHWNRQWKPYCSTLVSIDGLFIGITIIEMSEKVATKSVKGRYVRDDKNTKLMAAIGKDHFNSRWISTNDLPCGRLRLLAYSPYLSTEWTMSWNETKKQELSSRIPSIIRSLKSAVPELEKQLRDAELERQKRLADQLLQQEKWRKEEIIRKANEAAKQSKEELFSIMTQWTEDKRVEQFFEEAGKDALQLGDQVQKSLLERLSLARQFLSGTSAIERLIKWQTPEEQIKN